MPLHHAPDHAGRLGAQPHHARHLRTPQVEVAVLQSEGLVGVDAVLDWERRGLRTREHLQGGRGELHLPGRDRRVRHALGPDAHLPLDSHDVLAAQAVRLRQVGGIRDDLHHPAGVAQVHEHHAAVVTPRGHPTAERDAIAGVRGPQRPRPVRAQASVRLHEGARVSAPHSCEEFPADPMQHGGPSDASIVMLASWCMGEERRTTVRAPTADLATLQAEADRRGVALAAVLSEAVAEKAASLRRRRRPRWASGDPPTGGALPK